MKPHDVFNYLRDHYWDSLEDQRPLLVLHLGACEEQLAQERLERMKKKDVSPLKKNGKKGTSKKPTVIKVRAPGKHER